MAGEVATRAKISERGTSGAKRSGRELLIWSVPPLVVGVGMLALLASRRARRRVAGCQPGLARRRGERARLALELQPVADAGPFPCCGRLSGGSAAAMMHRHEATGLEEACARRIDQAVLAGAGIQTRDAPGPMRRLGDTGADRCPLGDARRDQHHPGGAASRPRLRVCPLARASSCWPISRRAAVPELLCWPWWPSARSSRSWVGLRLGIAAGANSTQRTWPDRQRAWNSFAFAGLDA